MASDDYAPGFPARLCAIDGLSVETDVALAGHTRFAIGGPADFFAVAQTPEALIDALLLCTQAGVPRYLLGDGSNVVVADSGFRGVVLRYAAARVWGDDAGVHAEAGAPLQSLVDLTLDLGLEGLHTLTRIPGWVGGAVYGNAGAYGNSMSEYVAGVRFFDGAEERRLDNAGCEFEYRESIFKRQKDWVILSCTLDLPLGDADALRRRAEEIRAVRDEKFPPTMLCAGSVFKNLYVRDLPRAAAAEIPDQAVRGGKVASAYFLDQVGAKGMRQGGIAIADYHANLLYNAGGGSAADVVSLVTKLKTRIRERYGFEVEEEVQYVGDVAR